MPHCSTIWGDPNNTKLIWNYVVDNRRMLLYPCGKFDLNREESPPRCRLTLLVAEGARRPMYGWGMFPTARLASCDWIATTEFNRATHRHNRGTDPSSVLSPGIFARR